MTGHDKFERVSAAEAAKRLGVSVETIKRRLKLGRIVGQRDNAGKWWVSLPRVAIANPDSAKAVPRYDSAMAMPYQPASPEPPQKAPDAGEMMPVSLHRETIAALQAGHVAAIQALQQVIADRGRQHEQAVSVMIQRHQNHLNLVVHQHQASMGLLVERIDRAEVVIDQLLEDRRPWWRRLFGR